MLSRRRHRDEAGSIALVTLVLVVMAMLAAARVARVTSEGRRVSDGGHRVAALEAADGGLTAAQARVAAGESDRFGITGGPDEDLTWRAEATPVAPQQREQRSEGRSGRVPVTQRADLVVADGTRWHLAGWEQVESSSGG